ncbi:MAG: hypothetical protein R3C39_11585 [Dehalococcoidia bacterium]
MAGWAEFAGGSAEVLRVADGTTDDPRGHEWRVLEGGAASIAAAGERLLAASPAGIALLATVARDGGARIHPFMPRVIDGALVAFVITDSPKLRDLLDGRLCAIHSGLAEEDEEFWVRGRGSIVDEPRRVERALEAMDWAKPELEVLVEFDLVAAGWTRWLDFGTPRHRPLHHRWRAAS